MNSASTHRPASLPIEMTTLQVTAKPMESGSHKMQRVAEDKSKVTTVSTYEPCERLFRMFSNMLEALAP